MSYSASAQMFYGFPLKEGVKLSNEIVDEYDGYGEHYTNAVRLVTLGDCRSGAYWAVALTRSLVEADEFETPPAIDLEKLVKLVPDNAEEHFKKFCDEAGVEFSKPAWRLGVCIS